MDQYGRRMRIYGIDCKNETLLQLGGFRTHIWIYSYWLLYKTSFAILTRNVARKSLIWLYVNMMNEDNSFFLSWNSSSSLHFFPETIFFSPLSVVWHLSPTWASLCVRTNWLSSNLSLFPSICSPFNHRESEAGKKKIDNVWTGRREMRLQTKKYYYPRAEKAEKLHVDGPGTNVLHYQHNMILRYRYLRWSCSTKVAQNSCHSELLLNVAFF